MTAYYNEIDPYAAQWLRNLIAAGHIAPGDVDERSIIDVKPDDLRPYTQCHFFAGVGVWSHALRAAGWGDDTPVWTGSCPCQPFSSAGKSKGFDDERHLWPAWFHLITQCEPGRIFGEQVASKDGLAWLDVVQTDLEEADYASGALDICSAGVGAPHIRQRSWFVAERMADSAGLGQPEGRERLTSSKRNGVAGDGTAGRVGDTDNAGLQKHGRPDDVHIRKPNRTDTARLDLDAGVHGGLADPASSGRGQSVQPLPGGAPERGRGDVLDTGYGDPGPTNGYWRDADWLRCRDAKWRCARPGTFPLANGATSRVGRLRAYGNAINAEAARVFIESYLEV